MSETPLRGTAAAEQADEPMIGGIEIDNGLVANIGAGLRRDSIRDDPEQEDSDEDDLPRNDARRNEGGPTEPGRRGESEAFGESLGALATIGDDGQGPANLPAAFELIAEASAAVKIAEDRVHSAESALEDATSYFAGQIEALTEKLGMADRRAEVAELHAARAEERLRMFCQTILTTMHGL